jgi:hypothetical protein
MLESAEGLVLSNLVFLLLGLYFGSRLSAPWVLYRERHQPTGVIGGEIDDYTPEIIPIDDVDLLESPFSKTLEDEIHEAIEAQKRESNLQQHLAELRESGWDATEAERWM